MKKQITKTVNYRVRWVIEGTWSGYNSRQSRVVHCEVTHDAKRAEAVRQMGSITYTDGTCLYLSVRELGYRERLSNPKRNSYGSLISDCIRHGVNTVDALYKVKGGS